MLRFVCGFITITTLISIVLIATAMFVAQQFESSVLALSYGSPPEYFNLIDIEREISVREQKIELTTVNSYPWYDYQLRVDALMSPDRSKTALFKKIEENSDQYRMFIADNSDDIPFQVSLPTSMKIVSASSPIWSIDSRFIYLSIDASKPDEETYENGISTLKIGYFKSNLLRLDIINQEWETLIEAEINQVYILAPHWLPDGKTIGLLQISEANYYSDWTVYNTENNQNIKICDTYYFAAPPVPSPNKKYATFLVREGYVDLENVIICDLNTGIAKTILKDQNNIKAIGWK
jgi:Tol biopolymer transport system component